MNFYNSGEDWNYKEYWELLKQEKRLTKKLKRLQSLPQNFETTSQIILVSEKLEPILFALEDYEMVIRTQILYENRFKCVSVLKKYRKIRITPTDVKDPYIQIYYSDEMSNKEKFVFEFETIYRKPLNNLRTDFEKLANFKVTSLPGEFKKDIALLFDLVVSLNLSKDPEKFLFHGKTIDWWLNEFILKLELYL